MKRIKVLRYLDTKCSCSVEFKLWGGGAVLTLLLQVTSWLLVMCIMKRECKSVNLRKAKSESPGHCNSVNSVPAFYQSFTVEERN